MKNKTAVLFLTHFFDKNIETLYSKIRKDCSENHDVFLAFDCSNHVSNRLKQVSQSEKFFWSPKDYSKFNYPKKTSKAAAEWFYNCLDLVPMLFSERYPHYEYIWSIEYDVQFSGSWSTCLDYFIDNTSDLLATSITRYDRIPNWYLWKTLSSPMYALNHKKMVRAFLPFYRISKRGLSALNLSYRKGCAGHYEAAVASILSCHNLKIEDIGGTGEFTDQKNRNRFYTSSPLNDDLSPGSFAYRPFIEKMGSDTDKLWHPVKLSSYVSWDEANRNSIWLKIKRRLRMAYHSLLERIKNSYKI